MIQASESRVDHPVGRIPGRQFGIRRRGGTVGGGGDGGVAFLPGLFCPMAARAVMVRRHQDGARGAEAVINRFARRRGGAARRGLETARCLDIWIADCDREQDSRALTREEGCLKKGAGGGGKKGGREGGLGPQEAKEDEGLGTQCDSKEKRRKKNTRCKGEES
ncbi:hypothetical protein VTK73DRAFT_8269 [Phialemonium thermophilum]|uniref:Uncharacterized protein n=1 Tax=Phialemonium thermophilum TaxID=223376 RepID=A0ABR3W991_9PEZI